MKLYYDYENRKLMDGLNSGQQIQNLTMVFRDQMDITLYVMKLNDSTGLNELADPPAGMAPLFGLKGITQEDLAGDYLAVQAVWTSTATGTYTATIDLATAELETELAEETSVELKAEFTLRDADELDHYSTQIDVTVNYDVNGLGEGATHSVYLGTSTLVHEEVIAGIKRVIICNSDGVELLCLPPREV